MAARVGALSLMTGLVAVAAAFLAQPAWQMQLVLAGIALVAVGFLVLGLTGPPPLEGATRGGLFIAGIGSLGLGVAASGAVTDWSILGYLIVGGALVAIGSLIAGIAMARMTGRARTVGFVLLLGAIPWLLGAFVGAGSNLPFFVLGAGFLAAGYVGIGLLALGVVRQYPELDPT
jgi:hypothetical protein